MFFKKKNHRWLGSYLGLAVVLFLFASCSKNENRTSIPTQQIEQQTKNSFIVQFNPFGFPLDPVAIRSVETYTIMQNLNRGLVTLSRDVLYEGDLAESWKISDDFKVFEFKLKSGQHFSNGDPITPKDIKCSVDRQIRYNTATHFNFSDIRSVSTTEQGVKFVLTKPIPGFLHNLIHPEFGVLHPQFCNAKLNDIDFSVTSGAYTLIDGEKNRAELMANPKFPHIGGPQKLTVKFDKDLNHFEALKENKVDFLIADSKTDFLKLEGLKNIKFYHPHYGFTYWLSINASHKDLKVKSSRISLSKLLLQNFKFPEDEARKNTWEQAHQLYLPDGGGRLSKDEVKKLWQGISNSGLGFEGSEISILLRKGFFLEDSIRKAFADAGVKALFTYYDSLKEFEELTKNRRDSFHLIQINNDFSSSDLYENIQVTINPRRPLVFLGSHEGRFLKLLGQLSDTVKPEARYQISKSIEKSLLEGGFVFPVALYKVKYIHNSNYNLEKWSPYFPEVSFWKITTND